MNSPEIFLGYLIAGFCTAYLAGDIFDALKDDGVDTEGVAFLFIALWPIALPITLKFYWNHWRGDYDRDEGE
jgi:hypothetical protein